MTIKFIKEYSFEDSGNLVKTTRIKDYLLSQENNIIEDIPWQSDFDTGLLPDDIITRSGGYNIFNVKHLNACTDLQDLLIFIRYSYSDYINNILPNKSFNNNRLTPQINAWVNVLREDEIFDTHQHTGEYNDLWSFISAAMCIDAKSTSTVYNYVETPESPSDAVFGSKTIENKPGVLTIFPPFYFHHSTRNTAYTRVSLGMDIFFHKAHLSEGSDHKNICLDLPDYSSMSNT